MKGIIRRTSDMTYLLAKRADEGFHIQLDHCAQIHSGRQAGFRDLERRILKNFLRLQGCRINNPHILMKKRTGFRPQGSAIHYRGLNASPLRFHRIAPQVHRFLALPSGHDRLRRSGHWRGGTGCSRGTRRRCCARRRLFFTSR